MDERTIACCEQFIADRDTIKSAISFEGALKYAASACIFNSAGVKADKEKLVRCKTILKQRAGVLSNFRSYAKLPVISMLAVSAEPEQTADRGLTVYKLLKKEFVTSDYLPLAAMIIAQMVEPERFEELVQRTKRIYTAIKSEHRFLTSQQDSTFCALLALSDKTDDELIEDMESCYTYLKSSFFSANSVQSLSHALALYSVPPEEKCDKTLRLFHLMKDAGYKYGTSYELPTLGVLAMSCDDEQRAADKIIEIDKWLSQQKGFGAMSMSKKIRLMYAGILSNEKQPERQTLAAAMLNGVIGVLVAQQVAMCAAIAGSTAAASSSAGS